MLRYLPVLVELVLLVYCLVDCIQTRPDEVRGLPRWAWIVLILLFPIVGGIAWLVAGRPRRPAGQVPWPATGTAGYPEHERPSRPLAPDDDPAFLDSLRRADREHEDVLRRWEEDLRRRERAARGEDEEPEAR
ncbi:PLD nuclease N-terminal domain-containing protein [Vallicoccus soli]|uniref:PLDc_N domain-containing protein n=1 Tax=Vallicoccus soli TaxID=2339232 RepID=A0A3A3ZMX0_9ACTN|nr:PLD nuclease N-terminal domain-containing protein [Vallicoccus soli]RJK98105.1 PLDc_N domain-containing protein [Vallicoccus soli]